MHQDIKTIIAQKANEYISEKGLTQGELATMSSVNSSYMSQILNGQFEAKAGKSTVPIADKYFYMLAEVIGYKVDREFWPHVETREFKEVMYALGAAKQWQQMKTIIVDTGAGKTYCIDQFKKQAPQHTYVITMHSLVRINDLFNELMRQLNVPEKGSIGAKRSQLLMKLRDIKKNGGYPIVVLDEAENMTLDMMKMIKGFYDGLKGYCSITLVGTEQLTDLIETAKLKDKQSGPQFYRRFKPGMLSIHIEQKRELRFKPFFDRLDIADGLRKLLCDLCDNYGMLHDYLQPALKEAFAEGVECDEAFFRLMYRLR